MSLLLRRCNFTRGVMRFWGFGARLWTMLVAFTKYANIFSSVQQLDQVSGTPCPAPSFRFIRCAIVHNIGSREHEPALDSSIW